MNRKGSLRERMSFAKYNFGMLMRKGRMPVILTIEAIVLCVLVNKIGGQEWRFGESVGIFEVFPVLETNVYSMLVILLGWVMLVCDIPFQGDGYYYYLIRSDKKRWLQGQMFFLVLGSVLYLLVIWLISILLAFPHLTLSDHWGIIMRKASCSYGMLGSEGISVSYHMVHFVTPAVAMGISFLLAMLLLILLGMIFLLFYLCTKRFWGYVAVILLVALDGVLHLSDFRQWKQVASYLSPVTVSKNLNYVSVYVTGYANLWMSVGILVFLCVVLYLITTSRLRKIQFS